MLRPDDVHKVMNWMRLASLILVAIFAIRIAKHFLL